METAKQLSFALRTKTVTVKVTEDEYQKLIEAREVMGKSLPALLREAFFNGDAKKPIFNVKEATKFRSELNRIGNNINQIARHLNSGFRAGWSDSFEECASDISKLKIEIVG